MVSSIYDPIGFLCPLILPAKLLLQELCRQNFGWDGTIPYRLVEQWTKWTSSLSQLADFEVPRCFKPKDFGELVHSQIPHFLMLASYSDTISWPEEGLQQFGQSQGGLPPPTQLTNTKIQMSQISQLSRAIY